MSNHDESAFIDQLCDEFENQLRTGNKPFVKEYLDKLPQESRDELLRELLALESELLTPDQWRQRLEQHTEDLPEYREIVEEFVEKNAATIVGDSLQANVESSRQIGPYKILQIIGEGGMGSVYKAEQEQPVKRRVALKVIKAGLDSKQVIARFEAERQALAMMDHPCIARILDAGTTDSGQPFFAMELVQGTPLNVYCDQHRLSIPERLEIFRQICEAIQHAHQKGIIHRDLKPSNILVAEYNGKPVPKIIDFGLAKALEVNNKLTDKTMFTEFGQVLGTLKYMSPEQAGLDSLDIDTRSDIYTLGVILYELLTGSTPLDSDSFKDQALLKILELVREHESPRPSSRLTTSKATLTTVTDQRRIDPRKLTQILSGDLDWIVMKAIDKDRNRRYESASAFADDVQRFLTDEAVEARPPSTSYKVRKFVKKNRGLVTAAATIFILLVAGIIGTSYGFYKADVARKDAVAEKNRADTKTILAQQSETQAKEQKAAADKAREEAAKSAKRSSDVLQIVTESFESTNPDQGATAEMSAKDVLFNAQKSMEDSQLDELGKAKLVTALAYSFHGLGETDSAISNATDAIRIRRKLLRLNHPDTLVSMTTLAVALNTAGRLNDSFDLHKRILQARKTELGDSHPDTIVSINKLALGYLGLGEIDKAISLLQTAMRTLETWSDDALLKLVTTSNLAQAFSAAGKLEEAIQFSERTLDLQIANNGVDHPLTMSTRYTLAIAYRKAGRLKKSIRISEENLRFSVEKFGNEHPRTVINRINVADAYRQAGRLDDAIKMTEQAIDQLNGKLPTDHPDLLLSTNNLALAFYSAGHRKKSIPLFEQTLDLQEQKLGAVHPDTLTSANNLAAAYLGVGRPNDALRLHSQTLEKLKKKLGNKHPTTLTSMSNLAEVYRESGQLEKAALLGEEVLVLREEELGADHQDTLTSQNNLALAYRSMGRIDEAIKMLEKTLESQKTNYGADHFETLTTMNNLALAYYSAQRLADAFPLYLQTLEGLKKHLGNDHPFTLATMRNLALAYRRAGRFDDAIPLLDSSLELKRKKFGPKDDGTLSTASLLSAVLIENEEYLEATILLENTNEIQNEIMPDRWNTFDTQSLFGAALIGLEQFDKAGPLLHAGYAGLRERSESIPETVRLDRLTDALNRLINFAEATGNDQDLRKWQSEREKLIAEPTVQSEKESSSGK